MHFGWQNSYDYSSPDYNAIKTEAAETENKWCTNGTEISEMCVQCRLVFEMTFLS